MQRSSRKSGCLFSFTLLLSLLLILLGVAVMVIQLCILTYFLGSFESSLLALSAKNTAPSPQFELSDLLQVLVYLFKWIVIHLLPGLSLFILGYFIPKHLRKRGHRILVYGVGWLVMVLSVIQAIIWNLALATLVLVVGFPAQG